MPLDVTIARRVEIAETHTLLSRLTAIRNLEGNPQEVHIKQFGEAIAFIVKGIPDPYFNSVRGLNRATIEYLDEILEYYRIHNMTCRVDIAPFDVNTEIFLKLAKRGYHQYGFHSSLFRMLENKSIMPTAQDDVEVRKLSKAEFELFGEIYVEAFQMPGFLASAVAKNNKVLYNKPGWHFYLASYKNNPAGIGVMHVQGRTGSLAAAAVLPKYQQKGCHSALLAARIEASAQSDCDLIVAQAGIGSTSQINMERMGLRTAYTKALWKEIKL